MHCIFDLSHNVLSIMFTDQDNAPAPAAHPAGASKAVDEVDCGVRHVVQDDVPDSSGVDAAHIEEGSQ